MAGHQFGNVGVGSLAGGAGDAGHLLGAVRPDRQRLTFMEVRHGKCSAGSILSCKRIGRGWVLRTPAIPTPAALPAVLRYRPPSEFRNGAEPAKPGRPGAGSHIDSG